MSELIPLEGLESFETEYKPIAPTKYTWSIEKYKIAQMYALSGKSKREIAKELNLPLSFIDKCFKLEEFQRYMQDLTLEAAKTLKAEKLMYLRKTLAARAAIAEEEGFDTFSRKDTLDIMESMRKETGDDSVSDSNYSKLLEKLVANTVPVQVINLPANKGTD